MNKKILMVTLILLGIIALSCAQTQGQLSAQAQQSAIGDSASTDESRPIPPPQIAQSPQTEPQKVKIGDILNHPGDFIGTKVVIEGKIISECGAGCWFTINDGTGTIYVDLAPSNLAIPQKRGAFARVYGRVVQKNADVYLIGEKVEF